MGTEHIRSRPRWPESLWLIGLCALLYLPGFFAIPTIDRDEARFAQASRQMAESASWHGWMVPAVQERPRLQKPPLIYWLQAASARLCTDQFRGRGVDAVTKDAIWMYRLPSVLSAMLTVLIVWRWCGRMFDPRSGLMAGALMAANPLMFWEARQARADMLLLACTVMAMWAAWEVVRRARHGRSATGWLVAGWFAMAAGIMTKGPITPLVVGLGVVVHAMVRGEWRLLMVFRPWFGVPLAVAPVAVWVWQVSREIDLEKYLITIKTETINRGLAAMEGHGGPVGYHVVMMYVAFLPTCMVVALGFWRALTRGFVWNRSIGGGRWSRLVRAVRTARAAAWPECFLVSMLIPGWIVFEVSGTKLPHYTLPLYPVLAILAARAVLAGPGLVGVRSKRAGRLLWTWGAGCTVFGVLWSVVAAGLLWQEAWGLAVVSVLLLLVGAVQIMRWTARFVPRRDLVQLQIRGVAWFVALAVTLGVVGGQTEAIRVSRNLNDVIAALTVTSADRGRPIAAVGWHEDSLIFETRGKSRRVDEWKLKEWLKEHDRVGRRALIVLERERLAHWPPMREVGAVVGFNYSNGKPADLVVAELTRDLP